MSFVSVAILLPLRLHLFLFPFRPNLPPIQQPASRRRRSRSMSVCVPPSSYSLTPTPPVARPKRPSTPPPALSSSLAAAASPRSAGRDTFAGRLSKALETVLPLHSAPSLPRARQRRASLPALFSSPVGSKLLVLLRHSLSGEKQRVGGERDHEDVMWHVGCLSHLFRSLSSSV